MTGPVHTITKDAFLHAQAAFIAQARDGGDASWLQPWVDADSLPEILIDGRFDLDEALLVFVRTLGFEVAP